MNFTWIPFYKELSQKLLQFRHDRKPLVDWIYENLQGYIAHVKDNPEGKRVPDIDPFTVFAIFNRGITQPRRIEVCKRLGAWLGLEAQVPSDFYGIPVMNNQLSNFIAFEDKREDGDIDKLWDIFERAIRDEDIKEVYDQLREQILINFTLTMGLFWIRPDKYLALDSQNRDYLQLHGIETNPFKVPSYDEYMDLLARLNAKMIDGEIPADSYPALSYEAWKVNQKKPAEESKPTEVNPSQETIHKWVISPGEQARLWDQCVEKGEISIGWDGTGSILNYRTQEECAQALQILYSEPDKSFKNDSKCLYEFAYVMKPGDIVYAKKGANKIVGRGIVEGDYEYDESREKHRHIRKVKWTHVGEWDAPWRFTNKTMTEIGKYIEEWKLVEALFEENRIEPTEEKTTPATSGNKQYWFVTANPKVWSLSEWPKGGVQDYSLYNDRGNKRRVFQNFLDAKAGDPVVCYESTLTKQIKCIAEVVDKTDGKTLAIRLVKSLATPLDFTSFKDMSELANMEYLKNAQGSFFKLTKNEYEVLMDLISEANQEGTKEALPKYTDADFLSEVFTSADSLDEMKHLLKRKKNIILQGAPGVGKTYSAKRLAYVMMGEKNENNISLVQFHQNYSYEDFIMGYKPEGESFELKEGVFFRFCRKALSDPKHDYFFIIDEINRGNMSKIFGELLMLIEKDYRGTFASLPYREERFTVPSNVYLIGMMNTADRSLAMIDYALRRRFSFVEMEPGFETEGFKAYQESLSSDIFDLVVKMVEELNQSICEDDTLGKGFQIGHSYLCGIAPEECNESLLHEIVKYDILPTLAEYWFDDADKVEQWSNKFMGLFE